MHTTPPRPARLLFSVMLVLLALYWAILSIWSYHTLHHRPPPKPISSKPIPGFLMFRCKPASLEVRLDGRPVPSYRKGLTLAPGTYKVAFSATGHKPTKRTVRVYAGDATMVRITLRPRKVWVRFTSEPAGAWVSSRNVRLGQTPFRTRILPRWWRFRLAKKGYVTETEDRLIRPSTGQHVHFLVGGAKRMVKGTQMHFVKGSYFPRGSDSSDVQFGRALCRRHSRQSLPCRDSWFTAEQPRRSTFLSSFWIDATEVTVRAYRRCVLAGVCRPFRYQQKVLLSPVVGVSWKDAYTYCHWRQARLPTEAEWEMAARGRKGLRFPWGNLWKPKMANHGQFLVSKKVSGPASIDGFRFAAPVRSFAQGRSPYGLWQMAGNVAEWVADCYYTSYYRQAPERNPVHQPKSCTSRVIRGGSWMQPPWELRATARLPLPPATQSLTVGFRCAQSVPTKPIKKANR